MFCFLFTHGLFTYAVVVWVYSEDGVVGVSKTRVCSPVGSADGQGSSCDQARVLSYNSVEAFHAGGVVHSSASAVGFQEGVLALNVVTGAAFNLALVVAAVRVRDAIGEAGEVTGVDHRHKGEHKQKLESDKEGSCHFELN